jgi:hypothetical protein
VVGDTGKYSFRVPTLDDNGPLGRNGGAARMSLEGEKNKLIERVGAWTAHNIQLDGDVYTMRHGIAGDERKLRRIVQTVADIAARPLADVRILDLACLEGMYAIEFARHGAEAVGIEGREVNLAKARFAKDVLRLRRLEFVQDDVRNVSLAKYGAFDVVLCLGILYHVDASDVFTFLEHIGEVCRGFAVVDTHVSLEPETSYRYRSFQYWRRRVLEHSLNSTAEDKAKRLWSSLDNPESFWLTRPSLYNALSHVGFTSVHECHLPAEPDKPEDRVTLVAMKGRRQHLISSPLMSAEPLDDAPELARDRVTSAPRFGLLRTVGRRLRAPIKKAVRAIIGG